MIFILDTNIYISDFFQKGNGFRALKGIFLKSACKLIIPEVILLETIKKYEELFRENISKAKKLLGSVLDIELFKQVIEDDYVKEFKPSFLERLNHIAGYSVEQNGYPNVEIKDIVERSIFGTKPFSSDGKKGFRDSVIWECVKNCLVTYPRQDIVFITSNRNDFSSQEDTKAIHPDLLKEVVQLKSKTQEFYYFLSLNELGNFLEKESDHFVEFEFQITSYVVDHSEKIFDLLSGNNWGEDDLISQILPKEASEPFLSFLEVAGSPQIKEIRAIDANEKLILVNMQIHLDARVQ